MDISILTAALQCLFCLKPTIKALRLSVFFCFKIKNLCFNYYFKTECFTMHPLRFLLQTFRDKLQSPPGQWLKGKDINQETLCQVLQSYWKQGLWILYHGQKERQAFFFFEVVRGSPGVRSMPIYWRVEFRMCQMCQLNSLCQFGIKKKKNNPDSFDFLLNLSKWIFLFSGYLSVKKCFFFLSLYFLLNATFHFWNVHCCL